MPKVRMEARPLKGREDTARLKVRMEAKPSEGRAGLMEEGFTAAVITMETTAITTETTTITTATPTSIRI
jgi:hypothetical protein